MTNITWAINRILRERFGYEIKRTEFFEEFGFQHHLQKLFRTLDIQSVLDVGGNNGDFGRLLREEVGYDGLIISFEPVRALAEALRVRARSDPDWIVCNYALGSREERMDINVMKAHTFSSFLAPDNSVVEEFKDRNVVDYKETVDINTLDRVMNSLRKSHSMKNIFLKIDTQGYDMEVIKGAQQTLSEVLALQTEISIRPLYVGMPGYLESLKNLNKMGFDIIGVYTVSRDALLRVIEFDCLLINSDAARLKINSPGS
jgi:FkbM family methyltransferase